MTKVSHRILLFSVLFLIFFIACPVYLDSYSTWFPLVQRADIAEFSSCFFLIPAYWYLFQASDLQGTRGPTFFLFLFFTTLLAVANGLHLAGNSIQHLIAESKGTRGYELAYFFHKPFSHYSISLSLMALSVILIHHEWKGPFREPMLPLLESVSALLYGFSFFCFTISGKVAFSGVGFSILMAAFGIYQIRRILNRPISVFFVMAHAMCLLMYAGWALYWKAFPNFDEVGMIGWVMAPMSRLAVW